MLATPTATAPYSSAGSAIRTRFQPCWRPFLSKLLTRAVLPSPVCPITTRWPSCGGSSTPCDLLSNLRCLHFDRAEEERRHDHQHLQPRPTIDRRQDRLHRARRGIAQPQQKLLRIVRRLG